MPTSPPTSREHQPRSPSVARSTSPPSVKSSRCTASTMLAQAWRSPKATVGQATTTRHVSLGRGGGRYLVIGGKGWVLGSRRPFSELVLLSSGGVGRGVQTHTKTINTKKER